jgi:hypothetical protein
VYVKAPMAHTPELWLELFDTIVGSLGWLNRDDFNDATDVSDDVSANADAVVESEGAPRG